jgi:hypothetical protein
LKSMVYEYEVVQKVWYMRIKYTKVWYLRHFPLII